MGEYLRLKKSNCKNCYKCIRHCPVKSISFSGNQAHILPEECILCGQCFVVCPQNAKEIANDVEKAKNLLQQEAPVIASIAPSFIANYNGIGINSMREALKKLGFADAEETAIGATIVKREYDKMLAEGRNVLISSCCPSVNLLIRKYYPDALKYLAEVESPMLAHCREIKRKNPAAKTVFIGPCISKKAEADEYPGLTDCVLTFEELSQWMEEAGVKPEYSCDTTEESRARYFPVAGGIIKSMFCDQPGYTYLSFDGTKDCINALEELKNGNLTNCFIEMSACESGCIGGPVMEKFHNTPISDYQSVARYAGSRDFPVEQPPRKEIKCERGFLGAGRTMPSNSEIQNILRQMGKATPSDELNCGSCGYNSCRDKAIAVFQGKADLSMCLPFLKEKAESFSNNIVNNSPNGILVLNEDLEVQIVNESARRIFNLRSAADILGEPVVDILNPVDFLQVKSSHQSIKEKRSYLAEYDRYVEQSIVYDQDFHVLICILRDVTDEEKQKSKKDTITRQTVETADKVVEKQMRIVQEIASLLGETAAETKIALTKLKESMTDE